MQPRFRFLLLFAALCLPATADVHASGSHPFYSIAPGTPLCSAGDPVICAWTGAGLLPTPVKYAVEVAAGYDPDCVNGSGFTAGFSFTTPDANPIFEFPVSALDRENYPAASVRIRVKALHPPSKRVGGAQNNPFSAWSAAIRIPGVCATACPRSCAVGMDSFLAQMSALKVQVGLDSSLTCSHDSYQQAGVISYGGATPTGVLPVVQGSALIGVGYCLADYNGAGIVSQGLRADEQAACATQFAPAFAALAGQSCDIGAHP